MPYDEAHFSAIREEVQRHLEDAEASKLGHWNAARVFERSHRLYLGLPATLLSIILAWLVSSQAKAALPGLGTGGAFTLFTAVTTYFIIDVFAYRSSKALVSICILGLQFFIGSEVLGIAGGVSTAVFIGWIGVVVFMLQKVAPAIQMNSR